uniref:IQ calmodulin-binding motif domain-containing protein, putative n=1 Tax=Neospora caninum (strain Liverpool) TaxID=572307 RepID=F0JB74_NEOCL|nr:IQ calmodulin-binding motif domain-containing protein, putative [Neospora caninum Liverpool]CEL71341.1 TPA: IQ calmodulin-binding motif domain-containing protein, putative [Neospora caninum Liverpool]
MEALPTCSNATPPSRATVEQPRERGERRRQSRHTQRKGKASSSTRDREEFGDAEDRAFPYYDTESEDEKERGRCEERHKKEADWVEEQRKCVTDQQRRFQALIDRLRLREGDVHLAPSVRNNVLSKLQLAVPSPASLAFSSPDSGLDASPSSFSHVSSFPASPSAAKAEGDEDPLLDSWTQASVLVRRLQQVHAQRAELERWQEEQRRLQQEQKREFLEKQREQEKKDWEEQMARQIACNRQVQQELDERLNRGSKQGDAVTPQKQIKKLLSEKPPDALIGLVKEAQAKGEEMFPVVPPEDKPKREVAKRAPHPAVVPRPGITLHVQSLQICWWKPEGAAKPRRRLETGQEGACSEKAENGSKSPGPCGEDGKASSLSSSASSSSGEDVAAKGRGTDTQAGKGRESEPENKSLKPPTTVVPGAVNYCIVAKYAEDDETEGADVPVFTTAWYAARVAVSRPGQKKVERRAGTGEGKEGKGGSESHGDAANGHGDSAAPERGKPAAEGEKAGGEKAGGEKAGGEKAGGEKAGGEKAGGEAGPQSDGPPTLGRRATVAAAYLGKALGQPAGRGAAEAVPQAGKEGGEAKTDAAPHRPVLTVVKEACKIHADITLPQLTPLQAMRVNENCLVLQIWRYEKQLRTGSKQNVKRNEAAPAASNEDAGDRGTEKRRSKPEKAAERLTPQQLRHHIEEVGRVHVLLEDPRVYDKSQSVFTITPVPVIKGAGNARQSRLRGVSGFAGVYASTASLRFSAKGSEGAEYGLPTGHQRHSKRLSLAATAITSSGTLYAFITSTTRKAVPSRSAQGACDAARRGKKGRNALAGRDGQGPEPRKEMLQWKYVDDFKVLQGPFSSQQMLDWIRAGYFEEDAPVCPAGEAHRLQPLRLVLRQIRRDAEEFRRQTRAVESSSKAEESEDSSPDTRRGSDPPRSSSPSADGRKRDEDRKKQGDRRFTKSPKNGEKPGTAGRTPNSLPITVTTTADSEPARSPEPSRKPSPTSAAPGQASPVARREQGATDQPGGLSREKGAEVQSVMKLLQEATNCLSRISSHRMSNYLRCTVADRGTDVPVLQISPPAESCAAPASFVLSPGGASHAMRGCSGRDVYAAPSTGPYSPAQERRAQVRGKMQALEQMFGRTALREACAVYIQAAVRGWLQRLHLWRTYQAEVAAASAAMADWEAQQVRDSTGHSYRSYPGVSAALTHFDGHEYQLPSYASPRVGTSRDRSAPLPAGAYTPEDIWSTEASFAHGGGSCTPQGYTSSWASPFPQTFAGQSGTLPVLGVQSYCCSSSGAPASHLGAPLESGSQVGNLGTHSEAYGAFRDKAASAGAVEWGQGVTAPVQVGVPPFLSYTQLAAERGLGPPFVDAFPHTSKT